MKKKGNREKEKKNGRRRMYVNTGQRLNKVFPGFDNILR